MVCGSTGVEDDGGAPSEGGALDVASFDEQAAAMAAAATDDARREILMARRT
jgi:hypothetical protein